MAKNKKVSQNQEDMRTVLATDAGRRVMWGILVNSGANASEASVEPHLTFINVGARSVGLELQNDIFAASPDLYVRMLKENSPAIFEETPEEDEDNEDD